LCKEVLVKPPISLVDPPRAFGIGGDEQPPGLGKKVVAQGIDVRETSTR
jgi:hypothetical protein